MVLRSAIIGIAGRAFSDSRIRHAPAGQVPRRSATCHKTLRHHERRHRKTMEEQRESEYEREKAMNRKIELEQALENEKWNITYRHSCFRLAVFLSVAKFILAIVCVGFLLYTIYRYSLGLVDVVVFWSVVGMAIAAPAILFGISCYLTRQVSVILMNESTTYISVERLSFWGGRRVKFYEVAEDDDDGATDENRGNISKNSNTPFTSQFPPETRQNTSWPPSPVGSEPTPV